ncbi:MAG: hypothetical protein QOC78_2917 [Solirubrobacteraceae bacterium]|nr:hypothetical protein [Solirubrobacteraceae bacterium]
MRMRLLHCLTALALGAATAMLVACGADHKIPAGDASQLEGALSQVSADYNAGRCDAATQAVVRARNLASSLPGTVDQQLAARLRSGLTNLEARVSTTCSQPSVTTQQQSTQPPTQSTDTQTTDSSSTGTDTSGTGTTGTGTDTSGTGTTGTGTTGTTPPSTTGATTGTSTGTGGTPPGNGG